MCYAVAFTANKNKVKKVLYVTFLLKNVLLRGVLCFVACFFKFGTKFL